MLIYTYLFPEPSASKPLTPNPLYPSYFTRPRHGYKQISNSGNVALIEYFHLSHSLFQFCFHDALCDSFLMIHKLALDSTLLLLVSVVSFNSERFISLPLSFVTLAFLKKAGQLENAP